MDAAGGARFPAHAGHIRDGSSRTLSRHESAGVQCLTHTRYECSKGSIVVRAPVGDVYRQWLRIEDFPKFMPAVKEVQKLDGGHFAIVISFNGKRHEGVLEIMLRAPERRLAWRALAGGASNYLASGVVSFTSHPNRSTCVILKICPGFNGSVSHRVQSNLRNFKRFMEHPSNRASENPSPTQ